MQDKELKGNLSVQAIAGAHVVLLGMDLPEQKYPRLLPKTGTASDATFANFSRSTMHLVKTKNRKARPTQTWRPYD